MKILTVFAACILTFPCAYGQASFEDIKADPYKAGGVYYAYPATKADNTSAPKGYEPFYISHFGRHGSRYLISDHDYEWIAALLDKAYGENALTLEGERLRSDLDSLMTETRGRGGALTPLGTRQHKGIARRMAENYPQVFADGSKVDARSTLVVRCVLSMAAFCESLKEFNPKLDITREASERHMPVICPGSPESDAWRSDKSWWREAYRKFSDRHTHPERLTAAIFSDPVFVERYVNPDDFLWGVYWLAADSQNVETRIDFNRYLTPEELFDLWKVNNGGFYGRSADFPGNGGVAIRESAPLVRDIIEYADRAIAEGRPSATLRFAHDGNVIPLTALLGLDGATGRADDPEDFHKVWCDFKVSPMAANIQMIFFRHKNNPDDIIVKFLHNEKETSIPVATDIYPYYRWSDVRPYLEKISRKGE